MFHLGDNRLVFVKMLAVCELDESNTEAVLVLSAVPGAAYWHLKKALQENKGKKLSRVDGKKPVAFVISRDNNDDENEKEHLHIIYKK